MTFNIYIKLQYYIFKDMCKNYNFPLNVKKYSSKMKAV